MFIALFIGLAVGQMVHWGTSRRSTTKPQDTPRQRQSRLPFNLKTLLMLLALFGTGFAWLVMPLNYARRNSRAIAMIQELRGRPIYEVNGQPVYDGRISKPVWLRHFGNEYFGKVIGVNFADGGIGDYRIANITDNDLAQLKNLNKLMNFRILILGVNVAAVSEKTAFGCLLGNKKAMFG